jgi:hypothetical protein
LGADAKPVHEENDGRPSSPAIGIEHVRIGDTIRRFDIQSLLGHEDPPGSSRLMQAEGEHTIVDLRNLLIFAR